MLVVFLVVMLLVMAGFSNGGIWLWWQRSTMFLVGGSVVGNGCRSWLYLVMMVGGGERL